MPGLLRSFGTVAPVVVTLCASACQSRPPGDDTDTTEGSSSEDGTQGMGVTSNDVDPSGVTFSSSPTTTATTATTIPPDPTVATITTTSTTGDDTFDTTTSPTSDTEFTTFGTLPPPPDTDGFCNDPPGQPQSSSCSDESGCGCASGKCFVIPLLGGFCSECLVDSDCPAGGCTIPDPVGVTGAVCNKGGPGDGCETDAVCVDPKHSHCADIIDVTGVFTVSTCSACVSNADCSPAAPNCAPTFDIAHFTGRNECVPNGSLAIDSGCSLVPGGAVACQSGHCGAANIMGLVEFGICGECDADSDCQPGQTCSTPQVDLDQQLLIGARCQ